MVLFDFSKNIKVLTVWDHLIKRAIVSNDPFLGILQDEIFENNFELLIFKNKYQKKLK